MRLSLINLLPSLIGWVRVFRDEVLISVKMEHKKTLTLNAQNENLNLVINIQKFFTHKCTVL